MSYREQRNVSDLLRRIGYLRLISLESFRQPNFLLVADILRWFMNRYDPSVDIHHDIATEQQRVMFIRTFVQYMLRKAGLKLNPKRLYQADGYAVKEITKVILFFSNATKEATEMKRKSGGQQKDVLTQFYEFQPTLHKVRATRDLSTRLTEKGVAFYDLITKEITNRTARETVLSKHFDIRDYEQIIRKAITGIKSEEVKLQSNIEAGENTINSLNVKIEKKRQELERSEQRLETMTKVRPAYMDEFEKLQHELEILYHDYVTRFRILSHLQQQMDEISHNEESRRIEAKLLKGGSREDRIGRSKAIGLVDDLSESDVDEDEDESLLDDSLQQNAREFLLSRGGGGVSKAPSQQRPQGTAKNGMNLTNRGIDLGPNDLVVPNRNRSSKNIKKEGLNMYSGALEDEEDESESDLLLLEGDNSDLGSEIDEDADLVMSMRGLYGGKSDQFQRQNQESKNSATTLNLLNGNQIVNESVNFHKATPPAPTGSRNNLDEEMVQQDELENYTRKVLNGSAKIIGPMRTQDLYIGSGDSLTKPLRPDPRYSLNGPMGETDVPSTLTGRPSTKLRSKRMNSGTPTISGNRPPTRPSSRATQLLDELNDEDF